MATPTDEITESVKEGLTSFKDGIVGFINEVIDSIAPNYNTEFVFVISVVIAILITRWQEPKKKYIFGAITALLIFFSLQFIGVGS